MNLPECGPAVGHFEALAQILRELVFERRQRLQYAVREDPQEARGQLRNPLVDGDDAAHMQRGFAVFIVAREDSNSGCSMVRSPV